MISYRLRAAVRDRRYLLQPDIPRRVKKEEPDTAITVKEKLKMYCHIQLSPQSLIEVRQDSFDERKEELERRRDERIREVLERLAKIEAEKEKLK